MRTRRRAGATQARAPGPTASIARRMAPASSGRRVAARRARMSGVTRSWGRPRAQQGGASARGPARSGALVGEGLREGPPEAGAQVGEPEVRGRGEAVGRHGCAFVMRSGPGKASSGCRGVRPAPSPASLILKVACSSARKVPRHEPADLRVMGAWSRTACGRVSPGQGASPRGVLVEDDSPCEGRMDMQVHADPGQASTRARQGRCRASLPACSPGPWDGYPFRPASRAGSPRQGAGARCPAAGVDRPLGLGARGMLASAQRVATCSATSRCADGCWPRRPRPEPAGLGSDGLALVGASLHGGGIAWSRGRDGPGQPTVRRRGRSSMLGGAALGVRARRRRSPVVSADVATGVRTPERTRPAGSQRFLPSGSGR